MNPQLELPIITRAAANAERQAILAHEGEFSYQDLLDASASVAAVLLDGNADLQEARVGFLVTPGFAYAQVQWGIWRAGGIAVPLCTLHPAAEIKYVLKDAAVDVVVADGDFEELVRPLAAELGIRFISVADFARGAGAKLPVVDVDRRAMIVYTSGTTSRPKGVVTTHRNVAAQIETLVTAWCWRSDDRILHVLPLHHVHGIINVLGCALWAGAACEMERGFDARTVWQRFVERDLTLFMAVPTIYARLIAAWEKAPPETRAEWSAAAAKMRLMVSGSAALPVSVLEKWQDISGHVLLERYGMTEIGMALSNPLDGERVPGCVGAPLPTVDARLVDESGSAVPDGTPGEIQVRGPSVFIEYWRRPEATQEAFLDGWFRTGDVASVENGIYRILGRQSVDIIKTGGYKVSALEIEEVLRTHERINECAVVGVPDEEWGESVSAAVVLAEGERMNPEEFRAWAKTRLAAYKVPRRFLTLAALPRNTMGKVTKPNIVRLFQAMRYRKEEGE